MEGFLNETKDADWVRRSFMVPTHAISYVDEVRRELSEAKYKFTDTTLGGNFAINPPPQYSKFTDKPVPSRFSKSSGMGRYYSEAIDDRGQHIHMRFGVPKFNSLTNFFGNTTSAYSASLANKGRAPGIFYNVGKAIGFVVSLPILPLVWGNQVFRFFTKKPASKFYYLKPAMPLYWNAVNTMINAIGVNMGVIGRAMNASDISVREFDQVQPDEHKELARSMASAWPYVYRPDGGVDVFAMANRAQRMARRNRARVADYLERQDELGSFKQMGFVPKNGKSEFEKVMLEQVNDPGGLKIDEYVQLYHKAYENRDDVGEDVPKEADTAIFEDLDEDGFRDFLMADLEDGSDFVTFRVDDTGSVSESFSNSTGQSELASKINSMSSNARSARFNTANFNFSDGVVGDIVGKVTGAVGDLIRGGADAFNLAGITMLMGDGFVDIPEVYEGSTANLPSMSYSIELRSPYGNPLSRFQNLYVPLSMLLAGVLPLSVGKQSYTSPFIVEIYSKGKNQCRLGIIDSMTITRGVGNLGWTKNYEPLGIDVSFTIKDLSSIMHMPIVSNFSTGDAATMGAFSMGGKAVDGVAKMFSGSGVGVQDAAENFASYLSLSNFDDDNTYTDYLAVLGSLSMADQIYPINKLRLARAKRRAEFQKWKSPAYHSNWMVGTGIGQFVSSIMHTQARGDNE